MNGDLGPMHSAQQLPPELQPAVNGLVQMIVSRNGVPAPIVQAEETIAMMREAVATLWPQAADGDTYELIAREAMRQVVVEIDAPLVLAPKFEHWFDDAVISGGITLERWYTYKQLLTHEKGFAPRVIDTLDSASSEVVDLLGDPRQPGTWKRRGLVIGDVQSGKTATYIGIVNKAADAGFRLVVLLTGGTESLRKQTQFRVDEGFLGKDSAVTHDKVVGVGKFPTSFLRGQGMTTHAKDFVSAAMQATGVTIDPNADHPYVFVIKKNKTALENLITWLKGQFTGDQFNIPMLVVDDESDYASVNTNYRTSGDTSPTVINKLIRELLSLATRSSYMAFTATPFANIFIDHTTYDDAKNDDLFPHHYIFALSSPSNYTGAEHYFALAPDSEHSSLVDVTDAHEVFPPKHKSTLQVDHLPESLTDALYAFVIASASRVARGDRGPKSMLVNVSRFKKVQEQVYELVSQEFARIKTAIEIHAQPPVRGNDAHSVIRKLADSHATYFADSGLPWEEVRDKLFAAVYETTVELVNSSRDKAADTRSRNFIAVGGDVLSRGLTLEGLTVSYFYRQVGAADTLLQMARWFGYRPGYEDLVRIWIDPDVADQFRYVSDLTSELRNQIREMRDLGKTPEDFGLMVRKHPESLAITAKRGVAESRSMLISLSGRRIETVRIPAAIPTLIANERAVRSFLEAIQADDPTSGWTQTGLAFRGKVNVARSRVADLLEAFRYDRGYLILANSLHSLVRAQTSPTFQDWTVGLVGGDGPELKATTDLTLPSTPRRSVRYSPDSATGTFRVSGSSARLAGSTDLARTFEAEGDLLRENAVYSHLPHPTLLIYALSPMFDIKATGKGEHVAALAASEASKAQSIWAQAVSSGVERLMALKIGIPGPPGGSGGDVVYILNGPAIDEFSQDYVVSDEDLEDLDD